MHGRIGWISTALMNYGSETKVLLPDASLFELRSLGKSLSLIERVHGDVTLSDRSNNI